MRCVLVTVLFAVTSFFFTCATCNRASPPQKVIRLALAASRASYMPWILQGNLYPLGYIKENAGTIPQLSSMLLGTLADSMPKPNVFSVLPPSVYNVFLDKSPCSIAWWKAISYATKGSQAIMLRNDAHKTVVFGFRGAKAYSLNDIQRNFIAKPRWVKVAGKSFSVHQPFLQRYRHVERWFEQHYKNVPKDFTVIVTGYDAGGSQAYVAALMVTLKTNRRPDAVVTFEPHLSAGWCSTINTESTLAALTRFPLPFFKMCLPGFRSEPSGLARTRP